jgi:hypothetical protein
VSQKKQCPLQKNLCTTAKKSWLQPELFRKSSRFFHALSPIVTNQMTKRCRIYSGDFSQLLASRDEDALSGYEAKGAIFADDFRLRQRVVAAHITGEINACNREIL